MSDEKIYPIENFPFYLGQTLFLIWHYKKEIVEARFEFARQDGVILTERWDDGQLEKVFLSDRGMPGFAYDDRPPMIFATREEAEAAQPAAWAWWGKRGQRQLVE